MSLEEDIWSEPLTEGPTVRTFNNQPLFIPDEDDDDIQDVIDPQTHSQSTAALTQVTPSANTSEVHLETGGKAVPDNDRLDAIFDEDVFADIDKPIDLEDMQRRAQAKLASTRPLTKSQPVTTTESTHKNDERKQRRPIPKLDEERLLGPDGFPCLLKEYKTFKVSGKGRELQDLERLFRIYHAWTHRLFPKYQFQDTVERVEKLCRSRRMAVNLRVWRDSAHGIASDQREDESASESEAPGITTNSAQSEAESNSSVNRTRSESRAPSVPSSATDIHDMDLDAILQEEEDLMREMNGGNFSTSKQYQVTETLAGDDEEALWTAAERALAVPQPLLSMSMGEADDDDMWDIADQIQKPTAIQNTVVPSEPALAPAVENDDDGLPTLGGDWDDMYE
ncbi:hypothetical protein Clacol_006350 [Clathrus columnatus]|uniref:Chromosome segregation in meiosis protein n=1 Tax=Clathrus columnatus TaxID=1419009 RepID=A0AAV5AG10_9AGAM|nr:hypothetical protein Clacol_006350 [Clathrus columnatus]